jgi:hypothetical protein
MARASCQTDGGLLVEIHNSQEQDHLNKLRIGRGGGESAHTWIGASDAQLEEHWLWTDGNVLHQHTTFYELSVDASSQLRHRSKRQQTHMKEHRVPHIASQTSRAVVGGKRRRARILYSLMWVC